MPRKFFRKYLPSHESVTQNRYFARFGRFLHHPNLWHLNRHSVAGGFAIGLFSGLVPGPLQMLAAALLAVPLRVNLPVALFTTFYTNPFTIGPLYVLAYQIGRLFVSGTGDAPTDAPSLDWLDLGAWIAWISSHGKPLAIGLVVLAIVLAFLGYCFVQLAWRGYVIFAWRRRKAKRQDRNTEFR